MAGRPGADRWGSWTGLDLLALGVATAPLWMFGSSILFRAGFIRHALDGAELGGHGTPNYVRNGFELASFTSAMLLFALGVGALRFTLNQIREARNTRLATIYMEIINRWNSKDNVDSRKLILGLERFYNTDPRLAAAAPSARGFVDLVLSLIHSNDLTMHRTYVATLNFYEDVGGLCWKGYVREGDIYDFMAGQIITQVGLLTEYIDSARKKGPVENRSTYANTIYLYKNALAYRSQLHEEDWPP